MYRAAELKSRSTLSRYSELTNQRPRFFDFSFFFSELRNVFIKAQCNTQETIIQTLFFSLFNILIILYYIYHLNISSLRNSSTGYC